MTVTLKKLAEISNTSVSTVSRVLAGKPGISAKKRKNILDLANRLNFQPNRNAQNLKNQQSHLLGFITSDLINPFKIDLLRRMERFCKNQDKQILVANSAQDSQKEKIISKPCYSIVVRAPDFPTHRVA